MEFENLRDALSDPKDKLEIIKTVVEDGAPITVAMASFSCHWIGPDPENNGLTTMWHTRHANLGDDDVASMDVRIRTFVTGQIIVPKLHHHIGSYWGDGVLWHVYLDRSEAHEAERRQMGEALREVTKDISQFIRDHVDNPDNPSFQSTIESDDFIRKILDEINNNEEGD